MDVIAAQIPPPAFSAQAAGICLNTNAIILVHQEVLNYQLESAQVNKFLDIDHI